MAVHVLVARDACSGPALSESVSTADLSQRYGHAVYYAFSKELFHTWKADSTNPSMVKTDKQWRTAFTKDKPESGPHVPPQAD